MDGDSFAVRLYGIDAPEYVQPGGREATAYLARLLKGAGLVLEVVDRDVYRREVVVARADGRCLNAEMVAAGYAWVSGWCRAPECEEWRAWEAFARENRQGLWAEEAPVPPWEWRKEHPRKGGGG